MARFSGARASPAVRAALQAGFCLRKKFGPDTYVPGPKGFALGNAFQFARLCSFFLASGHVVAQTLDGGYGDGSN